MRARFAVSLVSAVGIVLLCTAALTGSDAAAAEADPATLTAAAEAAYDRWGTPFDYNAYEGPLRSAIDLWEQALPLLPEDAVQSRSHVLNRLSQAYFELAEGYLLDRADRDTAYGRGKDAALASLRLDPTFTATEQADGFRAALRAANDVVAIFWYGNTLGQWLNYHQITAIMGGGVKDVYASFERSIELDEGYDGGGPHRAMGSLITQAYFLVGRNAADAAFHFERSIALDPTYLETYVNYAEYAKDASLVDELLSTVFELAADPEVMAAHPFYNHRALQRAERLAQ